jgi:hypothetical protein
MTMSRVRWEYLRLGYTITADNSAAEPSQPWIREYSIYRAGIPVIRHHDSDVNLDALLAELGNQGWELVGENSRDTVVFEQSRGWRNVVGPIAITWIFKRPAED